ncbi:MAG: nickel pincer cofactor biosynthesis protein LarC [Candidatus Freyarchaeota archaeon]|nr:nickel pincer cofactor biosynthesis protein LarC [Candidatus Freyrarchaeum guaymaensis]
MQKTVKVIVDCSIAGISGDMFLGAMVELGGSREKLETLAGILPKIMKCKDVRVSVKKVKRGGVAATKVELVLKEKLGIRGGELMDIVERAVGELGLSKRAADIAMDSARALIRCEAKIHGESVEDVHLHEAGSADTVFDLVGAALLCDELHLTEADWFTTPVAVGGGRVSFSHGSLPAPPPAVVEIIRENKLIMAGGPAPYELATPTGVAILAGLKAKSSPYMPMVAPLRVGYGAGERELVEVPNVLRVIVGEEVETHGDDVYIIETNLDDVPGEVIAYAMDALFRAGAKDAVIIPVIAKKGRPGCIIQVLSPPEKCIEIAKVLIRETGTLGVRIHHSKRLILSRETVKVEFEVEGVNYPVRLKIARDKKGNIIRVKPEFEDLKRVAEATGKALRWIVEEFNKKTGFKEGVG